MYDIVGTTLLVTVPVQGDTDGTQVSFGDGMASAKLTAGVMTLGGVTVSSTTASTLTPTLTVSTPTAITNTKAKIYLGSDDNFTVSDSGATLYGSAGADTVTIAADISGVSLDQNVDRVNFTGAVGSYTFKQTGNKINVYDTAGTSLLVTVPVQGDADGTVIGFGNGYASAFLTAGVMTLGGVTVSTITPGTLSPILK